jgi:hypothetical protein
MLPRPRVLTQAAGHYDKHLCLPVWVLSCGETCSQIIERVPGRPSYLPQHPAITNNARIQALQLPMEDSSDKFALRCCICRLCCYIGTFRSVHCNYGSRNRFVQILCIIELVIAIPSSARDQRRQRCFLKRRS